MKASIDLSCNNLVTTTTHELCLYAPTEPRSNELLVVCNDKDTKNTPDEQMNGLSSDEEMSYL